MWFVMRDLKRSNARIPARKLLAEKGFEVFTPMCERLVEKGGKTERQVVPAVADMLFVNSEREMLDPVVDIVATLQYRYLKGAPYRTPMTVSDAEMTRFIKAVNASVSAPTYFLPDEITSEMEGRRVMVKDGPLSGYEGKLLKVKGSRKRRLLVKLEGYLVAAVEIEATYVEFV